RRRRPSRNGICAVAMKAPAPPSWPGIDVRRTASLRAPMSRPSTSFFFIRGGFSKTWMRGTSPRMTQSCGHDAASSGHRLDDPADLVEDLVDVVLAQDQRRGELDR